MDKLDWGVVFRALENQHRRGLLMRLSELHPQDDRISNLSRIYDDESDYERFKTNMYHKHLPMLREMGFIDWDQESHEISPGPKFEEIEPILEYVREQSDGSAVEHSPVRS